MADKPGFDSGFGRGRRGPRRRRGDQALVEGGADAGRRRRRGRRGKPDEKKEWVPVTKLGRLVRDKRVKTLEEIYLFAIPIKEYQIIDYFLEKSLKDEVMKITPVQKQTAAGQRTRFKAWVCVGDFNGHIGLGDKVAREVATAIRGAIICAKLAVIPVRRGYWGAKFGAVHTVPCKVTGKCGSVRVHLVPAPRGTGLVAAPATKKVLSMAGYKDVYTGSNGCTRTLGNFIKATYQACAETYRYLTPDQWIPTHFVNHPFQVHTDFLKDTAKGHKVVKQNDFRE